MRQAKRSQTPFTYQLEQGYKAKVYFSSFGLLTEPSQEPRRIQKNTE